MTSPYDDEPPVEPGAEPSDDAEADPRDDTKAGPSEGARQKSDRRRRLDEVFGEVLPATADGDLDEPARPGTAPRDEEIRREVPPHY